MDINSIPLVTAFIGTTIAAIWDLKTTEVPDQLPALMIVIALLFYGYQSFSAASIQPILDSIIIGAVFSAFGLLMYFTGQWGGADSFILAAVGFLLPSVPLGFARTVFIFPLSYFVNLFIVGAVYMIGYAVLFSIGQEKVQQGFLKEMKGTVKSKSILLLVIAFLLSAGLSYSVLSYNGLFDLSRVLYTSLSFTIGLVVLFVVWRFAKSVELYGFNRRIPISKLRIGDMLASEKKLVGVTEKEIKSLKRSSKKYVDIKLGVPFAVAFPLALIATLYFGDLVLLFVR
ncbi:MAG: prepilin peptidase [Candidatus Aenigmarchaeota archaeon]|nr:prepilin peptidase [Candidatus Aenigmarchaeota archaeon]